MASVVPAAVPSASPFAALRRADRAIGGARFDAALLWGAPVLALVATMIWMIGAAALPKAGGQAAASGFFAAVGVLTYAHLLAVVPRAYGNAQVFAANRMRLLIVPPLLVAAFALSPLLLTLGMVLAVFWDVHHSAMQTFGLGRIYDVKAGNPPAALRRIDLLLNAALYIGPIAMGASMIEHVRTVGYLDRGGWHLLAGMPGFMEAGSGTVRGLAAAAWLAIVGVALGGYARTPGYRLPAHKLALLVSTAAASFLAWALAPPFIAFAAMNLFHAVQYFALVWLKEGARLPGPAQLRMPLLLGGCAAFGLLYYWAMAGVRAGAAPAAWLAPFVACSLLHFWYDGFVWSVRKKLVQ